MFVLGWLDLRQHMLPLAFVVHLNQVRYGSKKSC